MATKTLLDIWAHAGMKCAITKIVRGNESSFCAYVQAECPCPASGMVGDYEIETDMPWFAKIMVPCVPWIGISDATWTEQQAREAAEGLAQTLAKGAE